MSMINRALLLVGLLSVAPTVKSSLSNKAIALVEDSLDSEVVNKIVYHLSHNLQVRVTSDAVIVPTVNGSVQNQVDTVGQHNVIQYTSQGTPVPTVVMGQPKMDMNISRVSDSVPASAARAAPAAAQDSSKTAAAAAVSTSLGPAPAARHHKDHAEKEAPREIELPPLDEPRKSKVVLALISSCLFGFCGVDRCYMGMTCLGVIKGITFGGCFVWWFLDFVVISVNMLQKADSIDTFGFEGVFLPKHEIDPAFLITLIFFVVKCMLPILHSLAVHARGAKPVQ